MKKQNVQNADGLQLLGTSHVTHSSVSGTFSALLSPFKSPLRCFYFNFVHANVQTNIKKAKGDLSVPTDVSSVAVACDINIPPRETHRCL